MGYRLMQAKTWGKPFGNTLITFEEDRLEFTQWFKGSNDKVLRWNSEVITPGTDEENIITVKNFENYGCRTGLGSPRDQFEFLTPQQIFEEL